MVPYVAASWISRDGNFQLHNNTDIPFSRAATIGAIKQCCPSKKRKKIKGKNRKEKNKKLNLLTFFVSRFTRFASLKRNDTIPVVVAFLN